MKRSLKKNYKLILGMIIGVIISGVGAYAATTISSSNISYNNSASGLTSTNMKGAIDELYEKTKPCKVVSGTGTGIGDQIQCGTEGFYVVDSTDSTISMLSKYNLEVGSHYIWDESDKSITSTPIDNPSGIQNGNCTGYAGYFNGINYNQVTCGASADSSYTAYLNYLKTSCKLSDSTEIGSLTLNHLKKLGCSINESSNPIDGNCKNSNNPWIYSSTYDIERIGSRGYFVFRDGNVSLHTAPFPYGVRPVVTVLKSDIQL